MDGGPDENPRYQKVIETAIHHFKKQNFDAVFVATNAPGRSSFNRVERRMAPLSRELAGLILQHDHYGSHLDNSGKTTDAELEKKNFEHAGSTLAEVWNSVIVDDHPIVAEYIDPLSSELNDELHLNVADQNSFSEHVRTSQYFLQIVKCNNLICCTAPRSSYFSIVPSRFLPGPVPLFQTLESGLRATERSHFEKHSFPSLFLSLNLSRELLPRSTRSFKSLPYDLYNPSVQSQLTERICKNFSLYFASKVMLNTHMRIHKNEKNAPAQVEIQTRIRPIRVAARRQREMMVIIANSENGPEDAEWIEEDELDLSGRIPGYPVEANNTSVPLMPICSIDDHYASPWENVSV